MQYEPQISELTESHPLDALTSEMYLFTLSRLVDATKPRDCVERYWKESGMMYFHFVFLFASNLLDWYFLTKEN